MSGFLPPVVMKIMADGHQFITETGKVNAAMDASAANAKLTAEKQALAAREAASAATAAADKQAAAAATASKAAEVAALKTVEAQKTAAAAAQRAAAAQATAAAEGSEAAQLAADKAVASAARTAAAVDLAATRQAEAAARAAAAVELSATKQEAAQAAVRAADEKAAATAELTATRTGNATARIAKSLAIGGGILAAGLVAASVKGIEAASSYEKETTLLQTAGGELASNMGIVRDGILSVSQATGTSTDELAKGMFTVEKAGFRGAAGLNVLKQAAEGAKAENADMGTVTNALTSIMMSYHMKASQATSATNMLVAGAGAAKATMQTYAGSLSTVLPVASAAGISFQEVAGGIATLTQHGTSAEESTQELANTIRNLQAPNAVASKAMQQLGLDVNDVSTKVGKRGLTGTIQLITDAIASKLGPGGTVMVDTMMKSSTATKDLQLMLGKMPKSLAESSKAFLDGKMSQADYRKEIKGLGAEGSAQGGQFMTLAMKVKGYNDTIRAGGPAAKTAAAQLKAIMGGATGMNTALMLSSVTAKHGGENMKMFKDKVKEVGDAGKKSGSDISTWAQTSKTLSVQIDRVKATFDTLAITIGTIVAPAAKVVMTAFINLFTYLSAHKDVTQGLLIGLGILTGVMLAFYVGTKLAAAGQFLWSNATKVATGVSKLFKLAMGDSVKSMALYGAESIKSGAKSVGAAVKTGAAWVVNGAKGLAQGIAQLVAYGAAGVAQGARSAGGAVVAGAAWVAQGVRTAASFVATGAAMVASGIATGAYKALQLAGAAATGVATAAQWAFNAAMDGNPIMLVIVAVIALVAAVVLLVTHWKEVTAFIASAWAACMSWLTGAIGGFAGWWNGIWNGVTSFFSGLWTGMVNGAKQTGQNLLNWFRDLPGNILGFLTGLGGQLLSIGQHMIQGLIDGVNNMIGAAIGAITHVGGAMMDAIKGLLGIHSPSREFMKIGNWVTIGLANGVHEKGAHAVAAVRSVAQRITDAASAHFKKAGDLGASITPSFSSQKTAEGRAAAAYKALRNSMLSGQARTEMAEGAALDRAAARVWSQLRQIDALATQKVALAARLKDAQKRLTAATAVENKEAADQTKNLRGEFKLGDMVGYSAAEMVAGTKAVASRILAFGAKIKQLRSLGVNASLISEVAGLGSQDGTTVADSLIAGGKGQIAQLNSAYGSIQTSTAQAGAMVADGMYGAGVDSLKSLANGLTNNMSAIDKAASTIASRLTAGVKAELGLTAPMVHHPAPRKAAPSSHPLGLPHHAAAPAVSHKTVNNHVTVHAKNASAQQVGVILGKQLHAMS